MLSKKLSNPLLVHVRRNFSGCDLTVVEPHVVDPTEPVVLHLDAVNPAPEYQGLIKSRGLKHSTIEALLNTVDI
jgi:hypothetical protein